MSRSHESGASVQPELLPVQSAAQLLNVSTESILEQVASGTILIDFKSAREHFQLSDQPALIVDNPPLPTASDEHRRSLNRRRQQRYRQRHQLPPEAIGENELSLKQASNQSGLTPEYFRQLIKMGRINGSLKNGKWYIDQNVLEVFIQDRSTLD